MSSGKPKLRRRADQRCFGNRPSRLSTSPVQLRQSVGAFLMFERTARPICASQFLRPSALSCQEGLPAAAIFILKLNFPGQGIKTECRCSRLVLRPGGPRSEPILLDRYQSSSTRAHPAGPRRAQPGRTPIFGSALQRLRAHWPEYVIEATLLGGFMISACLGGILLESQRSPLRRAIPEPLLRRFLMGITMGLTAIPIFYSPWGKRSGAHINPAVSLTFLRLGKIHIWDAVFYMSAHCAGAVCGVLLPAFFLRSELADPAVRYVVTVPGPQGRLAALVAEVIISFVTMLTVLALSDHQRFSAYTGACVGLLLVIFVTVETPYSGMSLNPARTLGSAAVAHVWEGFWIYLIAPNLGMLAAAELHLRWRRVRPARTCDLAPSEVDRVYPAGTQEQ